MRSTIRIRRRRFLALACAAVAAPALSRAARGQGPVTLRLHHFLSPIAYPHTRFLTPWARAIEAESGGRLRIDIFPSMQLGGSAPQLYDQVREGKADIVWTLPGLTPNRFPRIEVFELPFVADRRAVANARAVQELYEKRLRDEFRDVHPICLWAHDRGVLHTGRPVKAMEDLKSLKVRAPTRLASEALKALGATGVTMPVSQVPDALSQRAIDGCLVPWEVVPALKLQERVKFHTEIATSPTLYTATFILAMNRGRYTALPPDLKKVLDRHSGQAASQMAARVWDDVAPIAEESARKQGNTITRIEGGEAERWRKATQPVVDAWVKGSKAQKFDGAALLAEARALVAKYGGG
jgi:TRAP-type C4-dicarboxylate transport system substrate-binding protein